MTYFRCYFRYCFFSTFVCSSIFRHWIPTDFDYIILEFDETLDFFTWNKTKDSLLGYKLELICRPSRILHSFDCPSYWLIQWISSTGGVLIAPYIADISQNLVDPMPGCHYIHANIPILPHFLWMRSSISQEPVQRLYHELMNFANEFAAAHRFQWHQVPYDRFHPSIATLLYMIDSILLRFTRVEGLGMSFCLEPMKMRTKTPQ